MEAEHCSKQGCGEAFTTSNYHITTTPAAEWSYVVQRVPCPSSDMNHGRRIPDLDELAQLPLCVEAELSRPEIIAVVLYTGPMVRPRRVETLASRAPSRAHAAVAS